MLGGPLEAVRHYAEVELEVACGEAQAEGNSSSADPKPNVQKPGILAHNGGKHNVMFPYGSRVSIIMTLYFDVFLKINRNL